VVERFLLAFLARARGSKGGTLLIVVGVLILFGFLVFGLVSVAGNAVLMMTGAGPVMEFLGTGPGVLAGFAGSVFIILLGVAFLTCATPQATASATVIQESSTGQAERNRELEQLNKKLRRVEQERDRLRAVLSAPTAKKRHAERMLRKRCLGLGHELFNFAKARRYENERETIDRFRQRHEWKVTELRDELDEQELLTPQERDDLTFRTNDGSYKIEEMVDMLRSIGMGH
jgi:hypothetical protein